MPRHARAVRDTDPTAGARPVTLAHPVSGHPHVDVPLVLVATLVTVVLTLVLVALPDPETPPDVGAPAPPGRAPGHDTGDPLSSSERLTPPVAATRSVALVLLVLAVVAGRLGVDDELENVAPALVVGAGWPFLVLLSLVVGPVWRWVDPWDTLARILGPGTGPDSDAGPQAPGHVWPAVVVAVPLLWFLTVYPTPLDPRAIGLVLGGYTTLTVAACLVLGRRRWLGSGEPVGLFLSWLGLSARRRLHPWTPPRGAEALVGVTVGGLLFGALRRTELWSPVATAAHATGWSTAAHLGACLLGAGVLAATARSRRDPGLRGAMCTGALVTAGGFALATALSRNRFFTSLQILPEVLADPFGAGWDPLGSPTDQLAPAPLGAAGLVAVQILLVTATAAWGAATAASGTRRTSRLQLGAALVPAAVLGTVLVALH